MSDSPAQEPKERDPAGPPARLLQDAAHPGPRQISVPGTLGLISNRPRSPGLGLVLSLAVYPGSGQAMNKRWGKAVAFALVFTVAVVALVVDVASGLSAYYRALIDLRDPVSLVQVLKPAVWPGVATLFFYVWAAVDTWIEACRLADARPPST